jgi:MFS family permease
VIQNRTNSPFSIKNIRLFIYFRLFFNCRLYYPVFTILFLDFGLTIEQFALLNVVWAASIVFLEVPSGALADIIGRKSLLIFAGALMVVEMMLLCLAPKGNPGVLFLFFLANRLCSGTAEAAASGADEALAYDSLKAEGQISEWGRVLEKQMRVRSMGFIIAMTLGAAIYDPVWMQKVVNWVGLNTTITQDLTMRFPLYMTLVVAILTLATTLQMSEVSDIEDKQCDESETEGCSRSIVEAFRLVLRAGHWILQTPYALVIILTGLVFDNCIRMVMTLTSQYYRLIHLPEATFGLIGSAMAVLGLFIPRIARKLAQKRTPFFNFGVISILAFLGLLGITLFLPFFGIIPMVFLFSVMFLLGFFQSDYLNRITQSKQRATVLSFNALSQNLAYGIFGILYSILVATLRSEMTISEPQVAGQALNNLVFIKSIEWFPWYFVFTWAVLCVVARRRLSGIDAMRPQG